MNPDNKAVLITGPQCRDVEGSSDQNSSGFLNNRNDSQNNANGDDGGGGGGVMISVESESQKVVDVPSSPLPVIRKSSPAALTSKTSQLRLFFGNNNNKNNTKNEEEEEMQELQDSEALTHIIPDRNNLQDEEEPAGFDVCQEYGYKYAYTSDQDDDDDDDDTDDDDEIAGHGLSQSSNSQSQHPAPGVLSDLSKAVNNLLVLDSHPHYHLQQHPHSNSLNNNVANNNPDYTIFLLGKHYHPITDYKSRRMDETSLFWFTYRSDFPEIRPYRITTDAGWGCMLRSAQMLLAQALRLHFTNRQWKPMTGLNLRRRDPWMRQFVTWFADVPSSLDTSRTNGGGGAGSSSCCCFSLHNMVAAGMAQYDTLPGEWYGPGTACQVLRDLCARVGISGSSSSSSNAADGKGKSDSLLPSQQKPLFRVHVADSQGTVYRESIRELMCGSRTPNDEEQKTALPEPPLHPLDPLNNNDDNSQNTPQPWSTPGLLLLIPLRLGLDQFQADKYSESLAFSFSLPQSVGVLGGRPRGARWFYGATSDGQKLFGLDPHTIQKSPNFVRRKSKSSSKSKIVVDLTNDYLRSLHTTTPECVSLGRLDPSLALGFYCRDAEDLDQLLDAFEKRQEECPHLPPLFPIADQVPDYSANESMMMSMMSSCGDGGCGDGDVSDEDDFVML